MHAVVRAPVRGVFGLRERRRRMRVSAREGGGAQAPYIRAEEKLEWRQ
jgi:hypothetical protein